MRSIGILLLACGLAWSQPAAGDLLEQKLGAKLRALDERLDGALGVAALDLASGRTFSYHGGSTFPQASSIKIPILIRVFQAARDGDLRLDQSVTLTAKDMVGGSGLLQERLKKGPVTLTVRDLMQAMIEHSDNLATNKLIDMAGMARVNAAMDELGFHATRLQRRMMDSAAAARNDENISTPLEMVRLVTRIYRGKVVDEAASRDMLDLMRLVKADFRKAVPARVPVASKPGDVPGVHCETGIVFLPRHPFALSVMSTFLTGENNPVPEAVALVYSYFEKLDASNRYGHRLE